MGRLKVAVLGLAAVGALAWAEAAWSAGRGARVVVVGVSKPPKRVVAGTRFRVFDIVRNRGARRSRRLRARYLASRDRRAAARDVVLGRRLVAPLRPGGRSRARRWAVVPPRTRPGRYWLIACTTGRGSCSRARRRLQVLSGVPKHTAAPAIAGTPVEGQALTAAAGAWRGARPLRFEFAWQRCDAAGAACAGVAGAAGAAYPLTTADVGATLRVAVTAANAAGARTARSAPTATIAAAPYANPVFADSAPDPFVLDDGGTHTDYWQFNTGDLFPILHSPDLIHWTRAGSAFTARPSWVVQTGDWHPWAPSVLQTDEGYVMYYVGVSAAYGVNCIGVATATSPGGPYGDLGPLSGPADADRPIGCGDASAEGAIDPSPFVDRSGAAYLYLSSDWAIAGGVRRLQPTISVIPLAADRLSASGPRGALFSGDPGTWEAAGVSAPTVEGPSMIERGGTYFLLYSGGSYLGAYGMGYATSASPTGPFAKSPSNPILAERTGVLGPGGGDAVVTGPHGGMWMVYHGRSGSYAGPRTLRIDPFSWRPSPAGPDTPLIAGPTSGPQPVAP